MFCGKAIIQLNLCRERSRFVLSASFCAPLFRKLMRNGFHYDLPPYKRYCYAGFAVRLFRGKGNERKFVFVIASFGTNIELISISFSCAIVFLIRYLCVTP